MTPTIFSHFAKNLIDTEKLNLKLEIRENTWITEMKMGMFLSVTRGSDEPPILLEIFYNGRKGDSKNDLTIVGKGVTFDTGGYSLKTSTGMVDMQGDMSGGVIALAVLRAAAKLELPVNVSAVIPLCENMISGKSTKPGDLITAMNGLKVEINNTDAEGRLILGDALHYAETTHAPKIILDVATLTGAIQGALGSDGFGFFTPNDELAKDIDEASKISGELSWRMPMWEVYEKYLESKLPDADLKNSAGVAGAGTAAMFLKKFVKTNNFIHFDIGGTMLKKTLHGASESEWSGISTRTLIAFLKILSKREQNK